jgi:type IV pilus biogenesis protein CpaD/CtpE
MTRSQNFALAISLALAGCATTGPVQPVVHLVTQEVKVAVPVACVDAMPAPDVPFLTRDQLLTGSGYQVLLQYDREVAKHLSYELKLTQALTPCVAGAAAGGSQAPPKPGSP